MTRKDDRALPVASNRAFTTSRFDEKEAAFQRGFKSGERSQLTQTPTAPPPQTRGYQGNGYQGGNRGYTGNPSRQPPPPNQTETCPYSYFTAASTEHASNIYTLGEDDEAYHPSPADTRYNTTTDAQFGETMTVFHSQAPMQEDFNDTHTTRHDMPPCSCNICQVAYPEDYQGLDNHMFDCHQIDIRSSQSNARKQYVNWMEHAALNVYEIKIPPNGYATFKATIDGQEPITVCADTGSGTSFMDESLLPKGNLYGRLDTVPPVTVRGIAGEKIVDKRMHLPIHVTGANGVILQSRPYVTKGIKAGIILGNDVLGVPLNKISLHLHSKQMQIGSIQVPIAFTSPSASPVSFHVTAITASTALKSCLKTISKGTTKHAKSVQFAMGNDQGKRVITTKNNALSHPSPTSSVHLLNNYRMLRFAGPEAEKIRFRFALDMTKKASENIPETPAWRRNAAPLQAIFATRLTPNRWPLAAVTLIDHGDDPRPSPTAAAAAASISKEVGIRITHFICWHAKDAPITGALVLGLLHVCMQIRRQVCHLMA